MSKLPKVLSMLTVGALITGALSACGSSPSSSSSTGSANSSGSSSTGSATATKTVKIGAVLPLTGDAAPLGDQSKKSMQIAVDEINAKGGIKSLGGAKLELSLGDSHGDPKQAVSETDRLIDTEKVDLLTGAYQSGMTIPATAEAEKKKKIWVAGVPSDDSITERGFKYTFRLADTSQMRVKTQIQFMDDMNKKMPGAIKNVALVYENSSWGQGVAKYWKEMLPKAGYNIVLDESYDRKSTDLTPVATKVKGLNPDAVLMVSYVQDGGLLAKAYKQQNVTPKAFIETSGGPADPMFIKNSGEDALNWFDVSAWEPDVSRTGSKEFDEKYFSKYQTHPSGEGVKEFVTIYTIADALERAASTDSDKLRDALAKTNLSSADVQPYTKTVHFDEKGTLPDPSLVIAQFQKVGDHVERVTVYPADQARQGATLVFPYKR